MNTITDDIPINEPAYELEIEDETIHVDAVAGTFPPRTPGIEGELDVAIWPDHGTDQALPGEQFNERWTRLQEALVSAGRYVAHETTDWRFIVTFQHSSGPAPLVRFRPLSMREGVRDIWALIDGVDVDTSVPWGIKLATLELTYVGEAEDYRDREAVLGEIDQTSRTR